ncbi:MAG: CvpA family protein [Clostridia bacterium]|nr:CvpA family protein [Clostridia bacterium]
MAVTDIVFIAILVAFGLVGVFRGFAKQVLGLVSGLVGIIVSFFLLSPIFNWLMGISFFSALVNDIGAGIKVDIAILARIAESAGKTQGVLISEYIFKIALFVILAILFGLLLRLIKKGVLSIVSLPVVSTIDKILGLALGLCWGALAIGVVFLVLYWFKDIAALGSLITTLAPAGSLTDKYLVANLPTIKQYFVDLLNFIVGKVSASV